MTPVVVTMVVILVIAALALAYAAYPHRGARVPGLPWLGDAVERAAGAVPVVQDGDLDQPADGPTDRPTDRPTDQDQRVPHDTGAAR